MPPVKHTGPDPSIWQDADGGWVASVYVHVKVSEDLLLDPDPTRFVRAVTREVHALKGDIYRCFLDIFRARREALLGVDGD